jgi:hypothetical protein
MEKYASWAYWSQQGAHATVSYNGTFGQLR